VVLDQEFWFSLEVFSVTDESLMWMMPAKHIQCDFAIAHLGSG